MFAVKSTYSIKTPDGKDIPFYVAGDKLFFKFADIPKEMYGALFGYVMTYFFNNYEGYFVKQIDLFNLFKDKPEKFVHRDFWHEIVNQDYSKVIAEVHDAQNFVKGYFRLDLPEDWRCLNVDAVIANFPVKATEWIEKCYKSLQILATNDVQKQIARRVYDKAWEILKEREKAANADKRPTVHETLAKFGLAVDDLINATLDAHKAKFDKQHDELLSELRMLLK